MALFLGITTGISNRLLQTKLSNIISLGYTIFWNGTKFMWTLPFLHAVSFLLILLSTVSTQGTGNVFLYERSISEYHKDVKISGVQMPYHYTGTYRKVASSIPVYYSIFDYFWGATNQDVLLSETCYYCHVQQSIKRLQNSFQSLWITWCIYFSYQNVWSSRIPIRFFSIFIYEN